MNGDDNKVLDIVYKDLCEYYDYCKIPILRLVVFYR